MARKRKISVASGNLNEILFKPESDWHPPSTFPDLSHAKRIGVDCETRDPHLKQKGPGYVRRDGYLVGVSLATDDGFRSYYPIRHEGGGNLDVENVKRYLKRELSRDKQLKVGCNIKYDLGWLNTDDIKVKGPFYCVQTIEALIDEERDRGYSLEVLSQDYLQKGKEESLLREAADAYSIDPKADLWRLHAKYVGAYAETDALDPILIMDKQEDAINQEDLQQVVDLENQLIPITLAMTLRGIRVDTEHAHIIDNELKVREDKLRKEMWDIAGHEVNELSGPVLAAVCDRLGIRYNRIKKTGNPTFTEKFLKFHEHPFMKVVYATRKTAKIRKDYVQNIIRWQINGRIHSQWNQTRRDEGGTRSGRFSCQWINLQQQPNPKKPEHAELGKMVRSIYIPEDDCRWLKADYRQQEPKISVHYAYLMGYSMGAEFRQMYIEDPEMDFYEPILKSTETARRTAKDIALGRNYGMGIKEMAKRLNIPIQEAKQKLEEFDSVVPFIKLLSDSCMAKAKRRGYITTLLGRRAHFNKWEPFDAYSRSKKGEYCPPMKYSEAEQTWPNVRLVRANVRTAFNRLIQGGGADQMKKAVLDMYDMLDVIPHITFHDEIGESVESEEKAKSIKKVMESAIQLEIPTVCDVELMDTWG